MLIWRRHNHSRVESIEINKETIETEAEKDVSITEEDEDVVD